ncbi:HAD-IA family hydrolase [Bacillus sp. J37]|uniref:HAD family hydrolase n=1 Tax=Bacillus sp. J37 TaxID=935837 RepID=UPI000479B7F3|nr:HAD-IA family hydrolase [Bacillus sp. J37]HWK24871.1 HAD-IA family hydrolase [Ureibacillus sp.]
MSKYSLLLFDLDDTLLSSSWFNDGLIQTLGMHPITRSLDASKFIEKKLHVPKTLINQLKNRKLTPLEFRRARWRHAFSYFNLSPDVDLIDELDVLFFKTAMTFIGINNSVTCLLNELKAHYHLGIVTNGLYDPKLKISHMGLTKVFSDNKIFHSEQLGYRKPDPEIYSVVLNHFTKKPEEALFIGDSWIHDVVGPMEVGMDAIWVNSKRNTRATSHIPVAVVSDVLEIRNILLTN